MNVRKIEMAGLGEMSACDTDGHRAVYRAADGNLYFGDLAGQNKQTWSSRCNRMMFPFGARRETYR